MPRKSAGILLYRIVNGLPEVMLLHPGGPYWTRKDLGAWTIPKGEFDEHENPIDAARRETKEETGLIVEGPLIELTPVRQGSGKLVYCWACEADFDPSNIQSNHFEMEWPPKSGSKKSFPEIDRAAWFSLKLAKDKIIKGQVPLIRQLEAKLAEGG